MEKYIRVYDNILLTDIIENLHITLDETGFIRTEYDNDEKDRSKFMAAAELDPEAPLYRTLVRYVTTLLPNYGEGLRVYRMYANCYTPSDCPEPHQDQIINNGFTVLVYANRKWDWKHGGETIFFDDEQEIIKAVLPKPGRVVVFDPTIQHTARVQNSLAPKYRYTIAIKFRYEL